MWRCGEEQDTLGAGGKPFGQLIAARLCDFLSLAACGAFMRFVDDNEVPGNLLQALGDFLLLGEVERGNTLAVTLPHITGKLTPYHVAPDHIIGFIKSA